MNKFINTMATAIIWTGALALIVIYFGAVLSL